MKLSIKSDYATRAVFGLARHFPNKAPLRADALAASQDVPTKYLVQILIELKAKGIAKSVRGKEGGYLLARPPAEITLGDVLRAVHGEVFDASALSQTNSAPELRTAWQRLQAAVDKAADSINFQQLLDESSEKEKMYYI